MGSGQAVERRREYCLKWAEKGGLGGGRGRD